MMSKRPNTIAILAFTLVPYLLAPAPASGAPADTASARDTHPCEGFARGSARLDRQCRSALDGVAEALRANPGAIVILVGHADNRDPEHFNTLEGLGRADNARRYLLDHQGIDYGRIVVETAGSEKPVGDNATPSGRARNRRLEIRIASPG